MAGCIRACLRGRIFYNSECLFSPFPSFKFISEPVDAGMDCLWVLPRSHRRVFRHTSGRVAQCLPQISVGELINYVLVIGLYVFNVVLWLNSTVMSGPHSIALEVTPDEHHLPAHMGGNSAFIATAHICDLALGLLMLPVSKASFLVSHLGLSVDSGARFHMWNANVLLLGSILHGIVFSPSSLTMLHPTFGMTALILVVAISILSLRPIRRRAYKVFVSAHAALAVLATAAAAIHSPSDGWYMLPGFSLYAIELLERLAASFGPTVNASIVADESGYIRLDVPVKHKWMPGQWARIRIHSMSYISHPFSAVKVEDEVATFIIKAHKGFTKKLYDSLHNFGGKQLPLKITAPIGGMSYRLDRVNALVCFAAGSGITSTLFAVNAWLNNTSQSGPVVLVWVTRSVQEHSLSALADLRDRKDSRLKIVLFASRQHRVGGGAAFNAQGLVDELVAPRLDTDKNVLGAFICGPSVFIHDVKAGLERVTVPMLVHTDGYTW
ncbi:hypothetical protein SeMB42_g05234 [Synchytrium endobioticum]|uniref:FAD-binding FR-type domain-containing protein n=1 Tax=Synchytrium endobioticum TaxID=286115 RepID=A0A507CT08_9FUNG|nr:hypothetical protein SeMB42_g05234 [Synchytrium endobioticum]